MTLFPYECATISDDEIPLGDFTGFSAGAGGDEGQILLISPSSVKCILETFETAYAAANMRGKREYERGALDVYGGIERLRNMEWLCIQSFHWDPEPTMYNSFRHYLEHCVENAAEEANELHGREGVIDEEEAQVEVGIGDKRKRGDEEDKGSDASTTTHDQSDQTADSSTSDCGLTHSDLRKPKA